MDGTYRRKSEYDNYIDPSADNPPDVKVVNPTSSSGSIGIDLNGTVPPEDNKESDDKEEKKKKKGEKPEKPPAVSLSQLFRYATRLDVFLMVLGVFGAIAHGAATPLQFIVFGELINSFIDFAREQALSNGTATFDLEGELTKFAIYYVYLAVGTLVVGYLQMGFWAWTATRQTRQMRLAFFKAILKQDIGWFDTTESGELNNRLTEDINKVNDGMGHKIALFVQSLAMVFGGFAMGFAYGWKLTLVILALSPLIAIAGALLGKIFASFTTQELDAYAKAGSIAEEVISSIRTVVAFGGERKEHKRYSAHLSEARDIGTKKALSAGLGLGFFQLVMFGSYALAFWYGSKLIIDQEMTGGSLLIVFFSVMVASMQLGQAGPHFEAIATAQGAAYQVFHVIDRIPPFDSSSADGDQPEAVIGDIEFKDVHFTYPSRPDVTILNGLNLSINSGQTVALVGESGCGKSTVVKLIQRFYDPNEGQVTIDGKTIPSLNIKWLRQHIGVVSQEPVLFATTIAENIRYGKEDVTQEEIEEACRMANAHDFISRLPQKYETLVGERGTQMSGGQKQRIAIARALVKDPKILLLDEATSALDTESEAVVQAALDKARLGRTTIIIAHRLSTVRNADVIAAIEDGQVAETGTHEELMQTEGVYRQLVTLQTYAQTKDDEEEDEINNENIDSKAAVQFMRTISTMSSDSETGEGSGLERKISKRLSKKLSFNRQHSALEGPVVEEKKKSDDKIEEEEVEPAPIMRIMRMNKPEWPYFVGGSFGAVLNGLFPMVFALLLGEILETFSLTDTDEMKRRSLFWSLMFLALGGVTCFAQIMQNFMFGKSGEILTLRLREMAFDAILKQEIGFFDEPTHSTGALTTALATHASAVKGATGSRLGSVVTSISTAIACAAFALYYGWKLTLLVLAFLPFLILASGLQMKGFTEGSNKKDDLLESGAIAVEVIENIRTVVSLGVEDKFYYKFVQTLEAPHKLSVRRAHLFGLSFGLAEAIMFCCNAAAFRFGGYLVVRGEMDLDSVMKVVFSVVIGAMVLGQVSALSPDYLKAKVAAARLFKLFDRKSAIDTSADEGLVPTAVQGSIQLRSVRFRYPTRQDVKVLRGLTLTIKPGQKVALVGSSGCGKSTVISLLERFYDALEGEVAVDSSNVRSLNIKWLRAQMGIVSQEPVLFGCSIAENIAYGDNSRAVSMDEIEAAAQAANIHSFINSLPKGYDTLVGDKGTLISGGQKQRIAIARALVRNPRILLLDEATSALDTDSEKVVQEALDAASEGRTTIVIAHRLSTVQNADVIAVIDHGRVVELGTHQELLALKATYYSLVTAQIQAGGNGEE